MTGALMIYDKIAILRFIRPPKTRQVPFCQKCFYLYNKKGITGFRQFLSGKKTRQVKCSNNLITA